eukprot:Clim_evm3s242 gene=Clim_evmTU3s242
MQTDHEDGQDTLKWLHEQAWFKLCPKVGAWGPSFLGIVQYAMLPDDRLPNREDMYDIDAMVPIITCSRPYNVLRPHGGVAYGLALAWHHVTYRLRSDTPLWTVPIKVLGPPLDKSLALAHDAVIDQIDEVVTRRPGAETNLGKLLKNEHDTPLESEFWQIRDYRHKVKSVAPSCLVAGWHDFFLNEMVDEYQLMREADRDVWIIIGNWHHFHPGAMVHGIRSGVDWLNRVLKGDKDSGPKDSERVKLQIQGSKEWKNFETFPPPSTDSILYLQRGGQLSIEQSKEHDVEPTRYLYDPTNPTPQSGGAIFHPRSAGTKKQTNFEKRADVVTFTTPQLKRDIEVIGAIPVKMWVTSSLEHVDFVARLCVVSKRMKTSRNIGDGYVRLTPESRRKTPGHPDEYAVEFKMWPTAVRFRKGERIRIQICSGQHPRYWKNFGTENGFKDGRMESVHLSVFHDAVRDSHITLPITEGSLRDLF